MTATRLLIVGLLVSVLFAGCSGGTAREPDGLSSSSTSLTSTPTQGPSLPLPKSVEWSGCSGWETGFKYPPGKPPGAAQDPNWADPEVNLFTIIITVARECERVSWGPFERPIRMVYEHHDFIGPPQTCRPSANETAGGAITTVELASLWVNDTELAAYLKQTYPGMPVYYSDIQADVQTAAPGVLSHVWKWGLGAQNQSSLNVLDDQQSAPRSPLRYRLFWYNSEGVGFIDMTTNLSGPPTANRVSHGTFYPPMLWGYIQPDYASSADWESQVSITGKISVFKDHECKQPV